MAFLRATNVGGKNMIAMAELRGLFAPLGFEGVRTLGASGNVVFTASGRSQAMLKGRIEKALARKIGGDVRVMLRTPGELRAAVRVSPFDGMAKGEVTRYVTFLDAPAPAKAPSCTPNGDLEVVAQRGREIFSVACRVKGRFGNPNAFVEKALKEPATSRNWNVVKALAEGAK